MLNRFECNASLEAVQFFEHNEIFKVVDDVSHLGIANASLVLIIKKFTTGGRREEQKD
jgi:hypothetical protein